MVSVFYPTANESVHSGKYSRAPYFPSALTAAAFSSYLGNSSDVLNITTRAYEGTPFADSVPIGQLKDAPAGAPVLLFSHGLGASRFLYSTQLADLASQGWVVVAPDHPYDALITEFDDGTVVRMPDSVLDNFPSQMPVLVDTRVRDLEFIATAIRNSTVLAQLGHTSLNTSSIGVLGHSLGGNTAAQSVSNSSFFSCGANFDGGIFGPVATVGLDKPFLEVGAANHNQTTDATFSNFWGHLRGFRREYTVNGTVHPSFMDLPVLLSVLGDAVPASLRNESGTIPAARLLQIETKLIDAFFQCCLLGSGSSDGLTRVAKSLVPDISAREDLW
ncbi:hypothetical protein SEUCBS140593_001982 [Sporothrix eucalyptigena]|uniref:1-alkyl-2-acetylglycerophosphocholine esterase n=1 Tax=Sporothrix eucalyptigena TaxID=1812306 RepID=A0ABP0B2X9_9PEZI